MGKGIESWLGCIYRILEISCSHEGEGDKYGRFSNVSRIVFHEAQLFFMGPVVRMPIRLNFNPGVFVLSSNAFSRTIFSVFFFE